MNRCEIRCWMTYLLTSLFYRIFDCQTTHTRDQPFPALAIKISCSGSSKPIVLDVAKPTANKLAERDLSVSAKSKHLLNYDLLLLRVDPALRILRGYRDHAFSCRKRGHEVMKRPVLPDDRNLMPVYHNARPNFCLAGQFNDMSVLDHRPQLQHDLVATGFFSDNRESVL